MTASHPTGLYAAGTRRFGRINRIGLQTLALREVMRFLSEHGEYVNFLGSEHSRPITELSRRIYGEEKYQHLQRLKQRYDPHNLFRVNYNVSPER